MNKKNKLTLVKSKPTGYKTFYVPMAKLEVTLYKVRAQTQTHAQEKFNYLHHNKASIEAHRKVTISETDSNYAYAEGEIPHYADIINRQVDHYGYNDESLDVPSTHITLVH
tara:strand:+ start:966 stop:1298 length:333 start_codon:yes stop_codon:yes gene_type:complete